jgi:hypothetical protein
LATQVRSAQLTILQLVAVLLFVLVPMSRHTLAQAFCAVQQPAAGIEQVFQWTQLMLKLPWEQEVSVNRCSAEAAISVQSSGAPEWLKNDSLPKSFVPLDLDTMGYIPPVHCGSRVVYPVHSLVGESPVPSSNSAASFFLFTPYNLVSPTAREASALVLRERLAECANQTGSCLSTAATVTKMKTIKGRSVLGYALYRDTLLQLNGGFPLAAFAGTTTLACASRMSDEAMLRIAVANCLAREIAVIMSTGLILSIILVRMTDLAAYAEIQALVGVSKLTTSERKRLALLRTKVKAHWLVGDVFKVLSKLGLPTFISIGLALASASGSTSACNLSQQTNMVQLLLFAFFVPGILTRGVLRIASLNENFGLLSETMTTFVVLVGLLASGAISRGWLFQALPGLALIRMGLSAIILLVSIWIPVHFATLDGWRRVAKRITLTLSGRCCKLVRPEGRELTPRGQRIASSLAHLLGCLENMLVFPLSVRDVVLLIIASVRKWCLKRVCTKHRDVEDAVEDAYDVLPWSPQSPGGGVVREEEDGSKQSFVVKLKTSDVASRQITAVAVLRHPVARQRFLQHLRAEFCSENALFAIDCWRLDDRSAVLDTEVELEVGRIWSTYIRPDSEMWVNISGANYKRVETELRALMTAGLRIPGAPGYRPPREESSMGDLTPVSPPAASKYRRHSSFVNGPLFGSAAVDVDPDQEAEQDLERVWRRAEELLGKNDEEPENPDWVTAAVLSPSLQRSKRVVTTGMVLAAGSADQIAASMDPEEIAAIRAQLLKLASPTKSEAHQMPKLAITTKAVPAPPPRRHSVGVASGQVALKELKLSADHLPRSAVSGTEHSSDMSIPLSARAEGTGLAKPKVRRLRDLPRFVVLRSLIATRAKAKKRASDDAALLLEAATEVSADPAAVDQTVLSDDHTKTSAEPVSQTALSDDAKTSPLLPKHSLGDDTTINPASRATSAPESNSFVVPASSNHSGTVGSVMSPTSQAGGSVMSPTGLADGSPLDDPPQEAVGSSSSGLTPSLVLARSPEYHGEHRAVPSDPAPGEPSVAITPFRKTASRGAAMAQLRDSVRNLEQRLPRPSSAQGLRQQLGSPPVTLTRKAAQPISRERLQLLDRARRCFLPALREVLRTLEIDSFARFKRNAEAMQEVREILESQSSDDEDSRAQLQ